MGSIINWTPKGRSLRGTTPFDVLSVKIGAAVSALACRKNPETKKNKKNEKRSRVKTISHIRRSKTLEQIVIKFCMVVRLLDIVTYAKLDGDRFGHFCVVEVEFQVFPLTLVVVLTTLWHYRARVWWEYRYRAVSRNAQPQHIRCLSYVFHGKLWPRTA